MSTDHIPFNRPFHVGTEARHIEAAVQSGWISARGDYGRRCESWLEQRIGCARALVTHSCTAALEGAMLLAGVGPDDEVIMPSYTFATTASSVALRGATPVFVDIRPDTLNLDESLVEAAVTERTRAIVPVHYAGVACEMDTIGAIARDRGLTVIEDAAQGILATYKGRPLGSMGDFGALSFHETKNVTCGEGGALLVNDAEAARRAEIVWDKGTNRAEFERGEVDRYTWIEVASSFGLGEVSAAFLWAQLERAREVTELRLEIWNSYHDAFAELEREGRLRRPLVPPDCEHNAHMYFLLLPEPDLRARFIQELAERDIHAVFHYVPLHSSPAGRRVGRVGSGLENTERLSERLVRLPLWAAMPDEAVHRVIEATRDSVNILAR